MSDNIPFDIQMVIIKWLPVKTLIQFRSVSKPWKSFIDSSQFIKGYGARHTQPHSHILSYKVDYSMDDEANYICLVDDGIETLKLQKQELDPFVMSPDLLKQYFASKVVGACHGLLCLNCYHKDSYSGMLVIWNPSIRKSFGIVVPNGNSGNVFGFGVCPVNSDPTVVNILCVDNMPWHVEVFTLSSGVWNVIPSSNLPRQTIRLNTLTTQVVIDRFIYWGACDKIPTDNGEYIINHMVVSFDLITKEFKMITLPDNLKNKLFLGVSVSKLRGSLVVSGYISVKTAIGCGVWVMDHDSSFRELFINGATLSKILGFGKNGEPIFETLKRNLKFSTVDVYDPYSQQIKNLGISGVDGSLFMDSYKESLLLLDHPDSHIYSMIVDQNDESNISRFGFTKY